MPIAVPTMPDSASGVSMQRSATELFLKATGRPEDAAETADVLAEHDDARVATHLDLQSIINGLAEVHLRHGGGVSRGGGLPYSAPGGKSRIRRRLTQAGDPPGARSL